MTKKKRDWNGPLVEATKGMGAGAIADALGYASIQAIDKLMCDPERQRDLNASRYRSLYKNAPDENKPMIEKFMDDLLHY